MPDTDNSGRKFGEIWWVQCSPSLGHEFKDVHPAVIVQSNLLHRKVDSGVMTVMIMSSYKGMRGPFDILIPSTKCNGLMKPTLLKVEYIAGFDRARFLKKIGELEDEWIEKIKAYLKAHFDIS